MSIIASRNVECLYLFTCDYCGESELTSEKDPICKKCEKHRFEDPQEYHNKLFPKKEFLK